MTIVLHDAVLIDGTGRDPVERARVVVEGERIASVGRGSGAVPLALTHLTLPGSPSCPA